MFPYVFCQLRVRLFLSLFFLINPSFSADIYQLGDITVTGEVVTVYAPTQREGEHNLYAYLIFL